MQITAFDYTDPVEFLNDIFASKQAKNPKFSLRSWAKQLGLGHVAMLSMVLNRKRRLLPSLSSILSRHFLAAGDLTETQARYFDILVLFSNASTTEEKEFYRRILASLRPDQKFSTLELDKLKVMSDWYHFAILEMIGLKNFTPDPEWIHLQLGGNVNLAQVRDAIERLLRLGVIQQGADGRWIKGSMSQATPTDTPHQGLRSLHSQLIQKAIAALEAQPVQQRDITAHVMAISKDRLPEAKKMIREFRHKMAGYLEAPDADSVYVLNVQLFDLLGVRNETDSVSTR